MPSRGVAAGRHVRSEPVRDAGEVFFPAYSGFGASDVADDSGKEGIDRAWYGSAGDLGIMVRLVGHGSGLDVVLRLTGFHRHNHHGSAWAGMAQAQIRQAVLQLSPHPRDLAFEGQHLVQSARGLGEQIVQPRLLLLLVADSGVDVVILLGHVLGIGIDVVNLAHLLVSVASRSAIY